MTTLTKELLDYAYLACPERRELFEQFYVAPFDRVARCFGPALCESRIPGTLHREQVTRLLQKAARMGKVYAVGPEYFILTPHLCALAVHAQTLAQADEHRRLNVKTYRESSGISRHLSLPLVEFFDHIGFTKRDPVGRKIRRDAREMFGSADGS